MLIRKSGWWRAYAAKSILDLNLDIDRRRCGKRLSLASLGASENMSAYQFERAFRGVMGITPRQYAAAQRIRRLKSHLAERK